MLKRKDLAKSRLFVMLKSGALSFQSCTLEHRRELRELKTDLYRKCKEALGDLRELQSKELYSREQKSHPMLQMPEFLQWNIPIGLLDASYSYVRQKA